MKHTRQRAAAGALALAFALALVLGLPHAGLCDGTIYRVKSDESHFEVDVGRAGLFKAFGHDHVIDVERFTGEIEWHPEAPESSRFQLDVDAASLKVKDEEVSEEDRAKIQSDMESKALALPENSRIRFQSKRVEVQRVEGKTFRLKLTGTLSLRGVDKPLEIRLALAPSDDGSRLTASGEIELPSDHWGVPQISAVGGAVKTKQDLELKFEIVAARE